MRAMFFARTTRAIAALVASGLLWVASTVPVAAADYSAGFIDGTAAGGQAVAVWYPSADAQTKRDWEWFEPSWAWAGEAASGEFPVILLSHGQYGRVRNHHETAAALARHGYIVAAVHHAQDRQPPTESIPARNADLRAALQFVQQTPALAGAVDSEAIGGIGYSLGGLSTLTSAGALPSFQTAYAHCQQYRRADERFCEETFPWWISAALWLFGDSMLQRAEFQPSLVDDAIDYAALAVVAPVGAGFSEQAINEVNAQSVGVFRLGRDDVLVYPHHAEYVYQALQGSDIATEYVVYEDAHHYAFISPPQRAEKDYFFSRDPSGFDRRAFLNTINADLVNFFRTHLPSRH